MEDGVVWKGPGRKQFQRGTRTLVVVMDKFTLEMGNSFSEGMHVPKHQVTYKKMIKEDSMFKKYSQVSKTWCQVFRRKT